MTADSLADPWLRLLEAEIRRSLRAIENNLATRRDHPSYGYTKSALNIEAERVQGMLLAVEVIHGRSTLTPELIGGTLAETLRRLRSEIKHS
jgi:hypothetical protein